MALFLALMQEKRQAYIVKYDAKAFAGYPEIMSKEQMRIACHISKRTALFLPEYNLITHIYTGKKTRCYKIKKKDIIAFMNDREVNSKKYIAPENWYKYDGSGKGRAYKIRIHPKISADKKLIRRLYEDRLSFYLIDWLCSEGYNRSVRKSKTHMDMLWEMAEN